LFQFTKTTVAKLLIIIEHMPYLHRMFYHGQCTRREATTWLFVTRILKVIQRIL